MENVNLTIADCVLAIKKEKVNTEVWNAIKLHVSNAMQTGNPLTADEETLEEYYMATRKKVKREALIAEQRANTKKAAEEQYAKDLEEHKKVIANFCKTFAADFKASKFETATEFKTFLQGAIKTVPGEPKKPHTGGGNGSGGNTTLKPWNTLKNVAKLREGSAHFHNWKFVVACEADGGCTREEMEKNMVAAIPTRKETDNKWTVYEAISGCEPLLTAEKVVKNDDGTEKNVTVYLPDWSQVEGGKPEQK
jgi:hypothetical protein